MLRALLSGLPGPRSGRESPRACLDDIPGDPARIPGPEPLAASLDHLDDLLRIRELPGLQLGVDEFVVHEQLELASPGGDQDQLLDILLEMRK
jgi:hypothetical protein